MEKFTLEDLKSARTCELHLDIDTLDNLIFQLILASNEAKVHQLSDGKERDLVLQIDVARKPYESIHNPFKKVYPAVACKVLGLGVFEHDDNTMGVHSKDDW